jgi:outer membrane protein assembly factor BamB
MVNGRISSVSVVLIAALILQGGSPTSAQKGLPPAVAPGQAPAGPEGIPEAAAAPAEDEKLEFLDRVSLTEDRSARRRLDEARRWLGDEKWREGFEILQEQILDKHEEDVFVERDNGRWVSARIEALKVLGTLPPGALEFYEQHYGTQARKLLDQGKAAGDPKIIAQVAMRYHYTEAGPEAYGLLGSWHLDHSRYLVAALCFERMLERHGVADKLTPAMLFRIALAFERAGEREKREHYWKVLEARLRGAPLQLGAKEYRLVEAEALLAQSGKTGRSRDPFHWPNFQGPADRAGQGEGTAPFLAARWSYPDREQPQQRYISRETKDLFSKTVDPALKQYQQQVLPNFHPIQVGGLVIFRSHSGVHAVDIRSGERLWDSPAERFCCLDYLLDTKNWSDLFAQNQGNFQNWKNHYVNHGPHLFYENSLLGTLSSDGIHVYTVEELPLPYTTAVANMFGYGANEHLKKWATHNYLVARSLREEEGNVRWILGGDKGGPDFAETYFLGPPLSIGDKIYVLAEIKLEIHLLCLDPNHQGAKVWGQKLCEVDKKLMDEPARRAQGCFLAYGDGILVCPTNAGAVFGVDLLNRALLWAHSYQEPSDEVVPLRPTGLPAKVPRGTWASSAPVIQDHKVVFAAADGQAVHCLDLRDGELLWRERQKKDLYLAGVHNGKVLLVGRDHCRALSLKDGSEAWLQTTGVYPSGRGVATRDHYFLPLQNQEVWALDIATGAVIGKSQRLTNKNYSPGNLILFEGDVISQTTFGIDAFPMLAVKEREITLALKDNPNDPAGRVDRGELRFHQGDLDGALDDLRTALANDPPAAVKDKANKYLYQVYSGLLTKDFARNEQYLKDLEVLLPHPDPVQHLRRRSQYLWLLAGGREKQGQVREAFQAYVDFARLGSKELIQAPDHPALQVHPIHWAQGHLLAMIAAATPEQRQILEEAVLEQWKQAQSGSDIEGLRRFVELFGSITEHALQARMLLVERLIAGNPSLPGENFALAETHLLYLEDRARPPLSAQALELRARLYARKGLIEDASHCYRELVIKYPKVVIRDGKTAERIFDDLSTDKRFIPYLDEARPTSWLGGPNLRQRVFQLGSKHSVPANIFLEPEGNQPLPYFARYRLVVSSGRQIKFVDRMTGQEHGPLALMPLRVQHYFQNAGNPVNGRVRGTFLNTGHIIVFRWEHYLYAYDVLQQKQLWTADLLDRQELPANPGYSGVAHLLTMPNGSLELLSLGTRLKINTSFVAEAGYVCYFSPAEGLICLDAHTGERRWVKGDVSASAEIFADNEFLYLVQSGTGRQPSMALRAVNGLPVAVPDFAAQYQRRQQILGRNLLLQDVDAQGVVTMHLYDVHKGVDVWTRTVGPNALPLTSQTPLLTGAVASDGKATILNAQTGAEVCKTQVDPALLQGGTDIHLLQDPARLYLAFNQNRNANLTILYPFALRSVIVNGPIYAFDRQSGKSLWSQPPRVDTQALVVDQFQDNPLLVLASRQGRPNEQDVVEAIDKSSGKRVPWDNQGRPAGTIWFSQLSDLNVDVREGKVEMLGVDGRQMAFKIQFLTEKPAGSATGNGRDDLPNVVAEPPQPIPPPPPVVVPVPINPRLPRPLPVIPQPRPAPVPLPVER